MLKIRFWLWAIICVFLPALAACQGDERAKPYSPSFVQPASQAPGRPVYTLAVHPLHNPERLFELYQPLLDIMNASQADFSLRLEASRGYEEFERKIKARGPDFILPNPYQTLKAMEEGYQVLGKMAGDEDFRGLILVRKDSGATKASDLRGQTVAFPAPTALAATMLPMAWLAGQGLFPVQDYQPLYSGSQESAIRNLLQGKARAAATWPVPWKLFAKEESALAADLAVLAATNTLPNNSLMAKACLPEAHRARFLEAAQALSATPAGTRALERAGFKGFESASAQTYQPVRAFLAEYAALFGNSLQ